MRESQFLYRSCRSTPASRYWATDVFSIAVAMSQGNWWFLFMWTLSLSAASVSVFARIPDFCTVLLHREQHHVDELHRATDLGARRRLRSTSLPSLIVRRIRLSTVGDRSFPVAAARVRNSLPHHVTSTPSLTVFPSRLKTSHRSLFLMTSLYHIIVVPTQ